MESTPKRKITRNRESLACTDCRRRKLKCDRCAPCGSCVKRGDNTSCTYQRFTKGLRSERERRLQAESRLEHLEDLVKHLAQQDVTSPPQPLCIPQVPVGGGDFRSGNQASATPGLLYNGSTHWSAMLDDIEELKYAIIPDEAESQGEDSPEASSDLAIKLVLGPVAPLPLHEILTRYLPAKQESDSLVAAYFRSAGIAAPFIHASSFQRQYKRFWENHQQVSGLWISLLFSIYHIASNTLTAIKENLQLEERYNIASASCLALGEYFRPQQYAVESLLLFAQAQILNSPSISPNVGVIFGLLIRLATSMGYHRDPALFKLSAFEEEMRRRVWSLCMQLDLLVAFQLGLPSNVQFPTWDTLPPRNLDDTDFDEETQELRPPRPDSEDTSIIFYIAKHRVMTVFEKILRNTLATGPAKSSNVDGLDNEIREVYSTLPQNLRPKMISDSILDSPKTIVTRLCVFNLYQKCLCVLHRPYVAQGRLHSIMACRDAALNIIRYFNDSYRQFLPGGLIASERWFLGSLTWHDYLLGITALCLTLCVGSRHLPEPRKDLDETLSLLQQARDICVEQSGKSKDSWRVSKIANATMLRSESFDNRINEHSVSFPSEYTEPSGSPIMRSSLISHDNGPGSGLLNEYQDPAAMNGMMTPSVDDSSWEFLEQFLDLPHDDLMATE